MALGRLDPAIERYRRAEATSRAGRHRVGARRVGPRRRARPRRADREVARGDSARARVRSDDGAPHRRERLLRAGRRQTLLRGARPRGRRRSRAGPRRLARLSWPSRRRRRTRAARARTSPSSSACRRAAALIDPATRARRDRRYRRSARRSARRRTCATSLQRTKTSCACATRASLRSEPSGARRAAAADGHRAVGLADGPRPCPACRRWAKERLGHCIELTATTWRFPLIDVIERRRSSSRCCSAADDCARDARVVVAARVFALAADAAAPRPPLWDDVAHPARRRCAALVEQARRHALTIAGSAAPPLAPGADALRLPIAMCCRRRRDPPRRPRATTKRASVLERARGRRRRHSRPPRDDGRRSRLRVPSRLCPRGHRRSDGAHRGHRRSKRWAACRRPTSYLVHYDLADELMAVGRLGRSDRRVPPRRRARPDKPVRAPGPRRRARSRRIRSTSRAPSSTRSSRSIPSCYASAASDYVFVPQGDDALLPRAGARRARLERRRAPGAAHASSPSCPSSPYAAPRAPPAAPTLEQQLDPRELEVSSAASTRRLVAARLAPRSRAARGVPARGRRRARRASWSRAGGSRAARAPLGQHCRRRTLSQRVDPALLAAARRPAPSWCRSLAAPPARRGHRSSSAVDASGD